MREFCPKPIRSVRLSKQALAVGACLATILLLAVPDDAVRAQSNSPEPKVHYNLGELPEKTRETLIRIMAAARSGDVGELRAALEWNELAPEIGGDNKTDPITFWQKQSGNGSAHGIMAKMLDIFERGFTVHKEGDDVAKLSYTWPYLAVKNLKDLKPHEEVDLHRLATPDEIKSMKASGKYSGYYAVIGADGTWHSFQKVK